MTGSEAQKLFVIMMLSAGLATAPARTPTIERINGMSLESVAATCGG